MKYKRICGHLTRSLEGACPQCEKWRVAREKYAGGRMPQGRRRAVTELSSLGVTSLVLKNADDGAAEARYARPSTAESSCGSRRAADLDAGMGGGGSVRAAPFQRDDLSEDSVQGPL